jgi:hypothetical protein
MPLVLQHSIRRLLEIDRLLRGQDRTDKPRRIRHIFLALLIFGGWYGAVMGTYSGFYGGHWRQTLYAALKVPILLALTFGLSLPSFYVLNSLLGLRNDFGRAITSILSAQVVLTVILAALAPFAALVYASGCAYDDAIVFHGLMFAIASLGAQFALRRSYRPLIARDARHRWTLRGWLVIYIFVGIQMGWTLRPFIGDPVLPTHFFRAEAFSNAYIAVAEKLRNSVR